MMASLPLRKLPVINLSVEKIDSGSTSWMAKCHEVTRALEEYGCFIALYDGVSQELHDASFVASKDVLDLPTEVKVQNKVDALAHSYIGQVATFPLFERLSIEDATTAQGVDRFTKLMWPHGNGSFCEIALLFSKAAAQLHEIVMRMVAKHYGIGTHYESLLKSTTYVLKFNKYRSPRENETNLGCFSHTDKSFMTIIHQQEEGKGLEIQAKDGERIDVNLSPSSFVVMAGDVCMAWSNGRIEAPYHQVMMMHGKRDRYSLVLASFIRDLKIEIPQELVDEDHPLQFEAFDHYKYIEYHTNKSADGNRVKGFIRSYCGI